MQGYKCTQLHGLLFVFTIHTHFSLSLLLFSTTQISLLASDPTDKDEQKLIKFITETSPSIYSDGGFNEFPNSTPCFSIPHALRVCLQKDKIRSASYLYCLLHLYDKAFTYALTVNVNFADRLFSIVNGMLSAEVQKRIWMMILKAYLNPNYFKFERFFTS